MLVNFYKIISTLVMGSSVYIPKTNPSYVLKNIMTVVFAVAGAVSLLIITISGLRLSLSQGNPEGLAKTRSTIIYALLGLLICISGTIIVRFVMRNI